MANKKQVDLSWFISDNYSKAEKFDEYKWFEQIFLRFLFFAPSTYLKFTENDEELKTIYFQDIKNKTFPDFPEAEIIQLAALHYPNPYNKVEYENYNNLWDMTISELTKNYKELKDNGVIRSECVNKVNLRNYKKNSDESVNKFLKNDSDLGRRYLTIDLNSTTTDIRNDFNKWLKNSKKNYDRNNTYQIISKDKMDRWANNRILAYLDLLIYFRFSNVKNVKETQIINLIDNDGSVFKGDMKDIKQTLHKLKKQLMSVNFNARLYKVACRDKKPEDLKDILFKFATNRAVSE